MYDILWKTHNAPWMIFILINKNYIVITVHNCIPYIRDERTHTLHEAILRLILIILIIFFNFPKRKVFVSKLNRIVIIKVIQNILL